MPGLVKNEKRFFELMEKGISALDQLNENIGKLASDEMVEIEPTPPQCPHCRDINPQIIIERDEGQGPLLEFLLEAICGKCKNKFYVLFTGWAIFSSKQDAATSGKLLVEGMMGKSNGSNH